MSHGLVHAAFWIAALLTEALVVLLIVACLQRSRQVYTGHLGIALAAKSVRHEVPLWILIVSTQACDWVDAWWWIVGHDDPATGHWIAFGTWTAQMASHSVPAVLAIAALVLGLSFARMRDGRGAVLVAAVALSHVPADYITGSKPTWPGGPHIGLALYTHPGADFLVEAILVCAGWLLFRRSLPASQSSSPVTWLLLGALVALQAIASLFFARSIGPT